MPTKKATKKAPAKKAAKKVAKKAVKKTTKKATKKVAKKAVKKTAKKTASKKAKKDLVYADNMQSFWVNDGQILNSLLALRDALTEMEKDVYEYHATGWQNDFAQWVDVVLSDAKCAADLRKARTPKSARTVVVRHLKFYAV
jgi:hypothetical protein